MRKFTISFLIIIMISTALLSGCKYDYVINLISKEVVLAVGSEVSEDPADYVRASKSVLAEMKVDVSKVDSTKIGKYEASVTYRDVSKDFTIKVTDTDAPEITLKTAELYLEDSGKIILEDIVDSVTDASDFTYGFSDDITKADADKTISDTLEFDTLGDYREEVLAKDEYENISVGEFVIHIVAKGEIPSDADAVIDYTQYMNTDPGIELDALNSYDDWACYYGVGDNTDENNRPDVSYYEGLYGQFAVDFIQPLSKYVWLTFNETYEYGYTSKILDTLKEKNVTAVFFVTLSYAQNNPDLIQRMLDEGHIIGNYTSSIAACGDISTDQLTNELDTLYNYIKDTYDYDMYLFRAPSGYINEQTVATAQSLGYRTVLWSYAYADWDTQNQPKVKTSLEKALKKAHGGAIYAFSGASSTNQKMLADFIDGIRELEYDFAIYQKVN